MQPETKEEAEALAALELSRLQGIDINKVRDSRFFPGYYWVSEDADGLKGLCMPAVDEREAVERFFARDLTWVNRGKQFTAYAQKDAHSPAVKITIHNGEK